jgi:glycosyltransferase involved in cell wall biosynthesis
VQDHTSRIPVDVVILTKNEERAIEAAIASVSRFANVWVIDSHSSDRTVELAEKCGARVLQFDWDGRYPKKKQWAMDAIQSDNEWLLLLDADERVTPELAQEIATSISSTTAKAFDVLLEYTFLGRRLKHGYAPSKRILVSRAYARFPEVDDLAVEHMWEVEGHYQPIITGSVGRLRSRLVHDDPDPLYDYFARHNKYSDWEAHVAMLPEERRRVILDAQSRNAQRARRIPFKAVAVFVLSYLLRGGFLDGRAGFHYAVAQAFYRWQTAIKIFEAERAA